MVEGQSSGLNRDTLPFELLSVETAPAAQAATAPPDPDAEPTGARARVMGRLPAPVARALHRVGVASERPREPVRELLTYLRSNALTYRSLPPAKLYYLHSYRQFLAVYLRCVRHRARFVYDAHDAYFQSHLWSPDAYRNSLTPWLFERIERICIGRAARFTTVSDGIAIVLAKRFSRRPEVVRNCLDSRLDRPVGRGIRDTLRLGSDTFLMVFVGNAKSGMTFDEALAAMTRLPGRFHLALVGRELDVFAAAVSDRALTDRVHLMDPVEPTQVTDFIRSADASPILRRAVAGPYHPLTLNHLYALPNGFFHAIAAGLPLLYPPLAEIKPLAERYGLGIEIDTLDPDSIASAALTLEEDRALRAGFGENAQRAQAELGWEGEERVVAGIVEAALAS